MRYELVLKTCKNGQGRNEDESEKKVGHEYGLRMDACLGRVLMCTGCVCVDDGMRSSTVGTDNIIQRRKYHLQGEF